jgi:hypothetical protein
LHALGKREWRRLAVSGLLLDALLVEIEVISINISCLDALELILCRREISPKR